MIARKFLSPLTDPNAVGGLGKAKAGRKPGWLIKKENGDPSWERDKEKWEQRKQTDPTKDILLSLRQFGLHPLFDVFTDTTTDVECKTALYRYIKEHRNIQ